MRKSMQQRIEEAEALITQYEDANLQADRSYQFLRDMSYRMGRGKYMTAGQRKYFDNLVSQGVPSLKNEDRVSAILAAAEVDGLGHQSGVLKDFAYKVGKGWSLSAKQEKYLSSLMAKAHDLKTNGRYRPTVEAIQKLEAAEELLRSKNAYYWNHRPGTSRAFDKAVRWLKWYRRDKVRNDLIAAGADASTLEKAIEPVIDEWTCNKVFSAVKKQLAELSAPKHVPGDMRWLRGERLALVVAKPIAKDTAIRYECLVDGETHFVHHDELKKRKAQ